MALGSVNPQRLAALSLPEIKSPDVLVVQTSEVRNGHDVANGLNRTRRWCILGPTPILDTNPTSVPVSSQAACAVLRAIGRTQGELSDFREMLDSPFVNGFPTTLGWFVSDADYPQVHPALWTVAALAAALQRVDLFKKDDIDRLLSRLEIAENVADLYHPLGDGGWNILPQQVDQGAHATSATALAFMASWNFTKRIWDGTAIGHV